MAKKNNNYFVWLLVIVGLGLGVYFLFFANKAQCVVDNDCPEGMTCSMDNKCIVPTIFTDNPVDGKCPSNTAPVGFNDPDCPLYCPPGGRTGYSGFCCVNDLGTATVNCETGEELNPSAWNNIQAFVTFGPSGGTTTTTVMKNVINIVGWTAPSSFPTGITNLKLWLDSVTLSPSRTTWTNAWTDTGCIKSGTSVPGCFAKINAFTVVPGQTGSWSAGTINMDYLSDGTYSATYKFCYQDSDGTLIVTPVCSSLLYTIIKSAETISFTVGVALG